MVGSIDFDHLKKDQPLLSATSVSELWEAGAVESLQGYTRICYPTISSLYFDQFFNSFFFFYQGKWWSIFRVKRLKLLHNAGEDGNACEVFISFAKYIRNNVPITDDESGIEDFAIMVRGSQSIKHPLLNILGFLVAWQPVITRVSFLMLLKTLLWELPVNKINRWDVTKVCVFRIETNHGPLVSKWISRLWGFSSLFLEGRSILHIILTIK